MLMLPAVVWVANFIRILILTGIALSFDTEVARGPIHGLTGLAVLCSVLAMTKGICMLLEPSRRVVSTRVVKAS
jgi:exosortase/archaeosortase family protein